MRRPHPHNHRDKKLVGIPRDYATNTHGFGTATAGRFVDPMGSPTSLQTARVHHELVVAWRARGRKPGTSAICARFGFTSSVWTSITSGTSWPGNVGFAALVFAATANIPHGHKP